MYKDDRVVAVIVAGGGGSRMGGKVPKQFMDLAGRTVLERAVAAFQGCEPVDHIIVVSGSEHLERTGELCRPFGKVRAVVPGGKERQDSVYNGIRFYVDMWKAEEPHLILVHDSARPFAGEELIERVLAGAWELGACVPCVPLKDSIRRVEGFEAAAKTLASGGAIDLSKTVDRNEFYAVQTPQGFRLPILLRAFESAYKDGFLGTDEGSLVERLGEPVAVVMGDYSNAKLTTPEDMEAARWRLENTGYAGIIGEADVTGIAGAVDEAGAAKAAGAVDEAGAAKAAGAAGTVDIASEAGHPGMDEPLGLQQGAPLRIGTGYDVHRLAEGRRLVLCGVEIPYGLGLSGHSDADVATHALMDAMLGALALGDIGKLFPDTEPAYEGISSMELLKAVTETVSEKGYQIGNADITIVAQKPKLAPYIADMRYNLAKVLGVSADCVSVKATTTERLGFAGRGEGIEAQSVCLLTRKQYQN